MKQLYYKGELVLIEGSGPVAGKKICALGDSNTQYFGTDLNDRMIELTGCHSVLNKGFAGASWGPPTNDDTTTEGSSCVAMVNKLCNPYIAKGYSDEFDIITIMYGSNNDYTGIGTSSDTDVTTTWGAMKYCFDKLLYYYRYGKIGVLLPPQRGGGILTDMVAAVKECCETYSIPYYDICGQGQIPSDLRMPRSIAEQGLPNQGYGKIYFGDNVHFSSIGKEQYYHKYARFLERLI